MSKSLRLIVEESGRYAIEASLEIKFFNLCFVGHAPEGKGRPGG